MRRGICKICRRRRQVSVGSYLCRECAAHQVSPSPSARSSFSQSPPPQSSHSPSSSSSLAPATFVQASLPSTTLPQSLVYVDTHALRQMQMLSIFLQAHTPVVQHRRPGDAANLSYFARLPSMDLTSPLLGNAVDSLCFAHLGRSNNDPRLVEASRDRYGKTLSSLGRVLQASHLPPASHRETVTSIMLISLYDESIPVHQRARNTWITHYLGLQKYLEAAGPSTFGCGDRGDVLLLGNLSSPLYILNLARRTRIVFSRPEWRSTLEITVVLKQWYPQLLDLPGLLEDIDHSMKYSGSDLPALCADLDETQTTSTRWFQLGLDGGQYQLRESGSNFNPSIEEHCFMASNETFTTHYQFTHPMMATRATIVWLSQLTAECTQLRIMNSTEAARRASASVIDSPPTTNPALPDPSRRSIGEVQHDAFRIALNLCRSIHYLSSLASLAHADFICVLMEVASAFFAEACAWKEMGWCQACLLSTEARIARVARTAPPTLCRIRDLAGDLAAGVRYRSWTGLVHVAHRGSRFSQDGLMTP